MKRYHNPISLKLQAPGLIAAILLLSSMQYPKTANDFEVADIGNCKTGYAALYNEGKGLQIKGYGTMFGMHVGKDQGRFVYKTLNGDFDIIAQVESVLSSSRAYAEGGIMIRESLEPDARMLGMLVANNNYEGENDQYTFLFRNKKGGSIEPYWTIIDGFYGERTRGNPGFGYSARGWSKNNKPERPFPNVWIRLIRQGNIFSAYRSFGEQGPYDFRWEKMSEINMVLPANALVGFALSANHHDPVVYGKIGNPESESEIIFREIIGWSPH